MDDLKNPLPELRNDSGQGIAEYVLLLAIIVSGILIVMEGLTRIGLGEKLMKPITEDFARAYRYGHPKATGYDEGTPTHHPRITEGENFRIFINPGRR